MKLLGKSGISETSDYCLSRCCIQVTINFKRYSNCFDINIKKSTTGSELLSSSLVSLVPNKKTGFLSQNVKLRQNIFIILPQSLNMYFNLINMRLSMDSSVHVD